MKTTIGKTAVEIYSISSKAAANAWKIAAEFSGSNAVLRPASLPDGSGRPEDE